MSEWKTLTILEFADVITGSTPSTSVQEYWDGDIEWVTPVDLSKLNSRFLKSTIRKISKKGLEKSSTGLIPAYNVVMSSRAPIGYFAIPTKDFTTNQGCKSFKLFPLQDSEYHYYNFLFNIDYFKRFGSGSTFAEISKTDIEKLSFNIPTSLSEQRKIARILSTIDAVIEKTEAAIAKYKAIKAGMMRDLFTRGIDLATGKLRPNYQEAPDLYKPSDLEWVPKEWEVDILNNVVINHHSGIYKKSDLYGEGCNIVGVSDLYYHDSINGQIFRQVPLTQTEKDNFTLNEGDLIYGESSLVLDGIAKALWVTQKGAGTVFAWHTRRMKIDTQRISSQYLYFLLSSPKVRSYIMSVATQTALTGITTKDYFKTPVLIPKRKEQEIIEHRLGVLDLMIKEEITNHTKQKSIKQGLMSDLLTGKKRVTYEEEKAEVML